MLRKPPEAGLPVQGDDGEVVKSFESPTIAPESRSLPGADSMEWSGVPRTGSTLRPGAKGSYPKTRAMMHPDPRTAPVNPPGTTFRDDGTLLPVTTLVLWLGCLIVGVIGLSLSYARPRTPEPQPAPVQAEILHVQLTKDPLPPLDSAPPPPTKAAQPPPLLQPPVVPQAPPLAAVAAPSPALAFALPVEGPTQVVAVKDAGFARPSQSGPATADTGPSAPVQTLSYGRGEGKQPAPEYPARAKSEGQEGIVGVRFSVGSNGRVLSAELATPSPWPLLDQSALRAVREKWRFSPGAVRYYEVNIRFQLER